MRAAGQPIRARLRLRRLPAWCVLAAAAALVPVATWAQAPTTRELRERLAAALVRQDAAAIDSAVAALNVQFGDKAGLPETPDDPVPIPRSSAWLTPAEAAPGFEPSLRKIEQRRWWRIGLDPTGLGHAPARTTRVGRVLNVERHVLGADRATCGAA
jgi:hypothetical protein